MDCNLLVGKTLEEARALLTDEPVVVTTAPPFEPRFRKPVWGHFRVLHARQLPDGVELRVARELLAETILPREEKTSGSGRRRRPATSSPSTPAPPTDQYSTSSP